MPGRSAARGLHGALWLPVLVRAVDVQRGVVHGRFNPDRLSNLLGYGAGTRPFRWIGISWLGARLGSWRTLQPARWKPPTRRPDTRRSRARL